jgi:hypothetical protein
MAQRTSSWAIVCSLFAIAGNCVLELIEHAHETAGAPSRPFLRLCLGFHQRPLSRGGQALPLRPKTLAVLAHRASNPRRLVTKRELLPRHGAGRSRVVAAASRARSSAATSAATATRAASATPTFPRVSAAAASKPPIRPNGVSRRSARSSSGRSRETFPRGRAPSSSSHGARPPASASADRRPSRPHA